MKKALAVVILALSFSVPSRAQFFSIVSDPGEWARTALVDTSIGQQIAQVAQQIQFWQQQYQALLNMPQRYQQILSQWQRFSSVDYYRNVSNWTSAANTGIAATGGYNQAVVPVTTYSANIYNQMPADAQARVQARIASIELADGANQVALQELGNIRANSAQASTMLSNMQNDTLDGSLDTQLQVSQKTNAAVTAQAALQADANRLLVSLAESQIIAAKHQRDEEASSIASEATRQANIPSETQKAFTGMGQAISNYVP